MIATELSLVSLANQKQVPRGYTLTNNPLFDFLKGAYSFPHDWWLAIHWSLGMQGLYGAGMQRRCIRIGQRVDWMLSTVRGNQSITYKAVIAIARYIISNEFTRCVALDTALKRIDKTRVLQGGVSISSTLAGRFTGGLFTNYASTGGRYGKIIRKGPARPGLMASHFILASAGAIIHLAIKMEGNQVSAIDLVFAILAGTTKRILDAGLWKDIFTAVKNCALEEDKKDQAQYQQLFSEVARFFDDRRKQAR